MSVETKGVLIAFGELFAYVLFMLMAMAVFGCATARPLPTATNMTAVTTETVRCGDRLVRPPYFCFEATPARRVSPGPVHFSARILEGVGVNARIGWCPERVSWSFGDYEDVACSDRGPWTKDRTFGWGVYRVGVSVWEDGRVIGGDSELVEVLPPGDGK